MAEWSISGSTPAEVAARQDWSMEAFQQAKVKSFWGRFMGEGPNNIIQVDRRFEKSQGDAVNLNLVEEIDDELGVTGSSGTALEGAEVAPDVYSESVKLDALRQAVRTDGKLSEQRSAFDMREQIKDKLAYWVQRRVYDGPCFRKMSGLSVVDKDAAVFGEAGAANTNILLPSTASGVDDITENNTISLQMISEAKVCAEVGVFGTTTMASKMRPVNIDGQDYYVYVGHPYDRWALKQDEDWSDAVHDAEVRGKSNPLFTGVVAIWDGVLLYFHDQVVLQDNSPGVQYSTGLFLGAQAGYFIQAQPGPDWVEKPFDYQWKYGIGTAMMFGFDKVRYNSKDYSCIALKAAAKNPKA